MDKAILGLNQNEALALSMHFHRMEKQGIQLSPMMEDLWRKVTEWLEANK